MKEQAIQYLAMAVHQATIVACVRDERGAIKMRATMPTEARTILSLVRGAGSRVHAGFEEGTQAQWLHDLLQPHAERVVVCNVRGKNEVSNKGDRIDAEQLSELLRVDSLKAVYHGASSVLTLKELVRNYNSLVEDATRVMVRIKALFPLAPFGHRPLRLQSVRLDSSRVSVGHTFVLLFSIRLYTL